MNEWVKVSDRLPLDGERVLISCEEGICTGVYRYEEWETDPLGSYAGDGCVFHVTHWMPLPPASIEEKK